MQLPEHRRAIGTIHQTRMIHPGLGVVGRSGGWIVLVPLVYMGIGHRVYKVLDPRAPHLKEMAIKLSNELGEPKWIQMSEQIATMMRERKGLNANVDFYSATVYYSLGIPTDLFTPIFAISRMSGWTAHVLEQWSENRLFRPLSAYVGKPFGQVTVPIDER
jgi:citrate synthase